MNTDKLTPEQIAFINERESDNAILDAQRAFDSEDAEEEQGDE